MQRERGPVPRAPRGGAHALVVLAIRVREVAAGNTELVLQAELGVDQLPVELLVP
jgi:hypothetical protein